MGTARRLEPLPEGPEETIVTPTARARRRHNQGGPARSPRATFFEPYAASVAVSRDVSFSFVLHLVCRRRLPSLRKTNTLLCLVTTRNGFASLSQFQIMLWSFVVMGSAVYVIALSGDLIPIPAGTLVLLGISRAAAVISKAKSESDATAAPKPLGPAAAAAEAVRAEHAAREAEQAVPHASQEMKRAAELAAKELRAKADATRDKAEAAQAVAAAAKPRDAVPMPPTMVADVHRGHYRQGSNDDGSGRVFC